MKPMLVMTGLHKGWLHVLFCITVVALLFTGMWLLNLAGFRFESTFAAVTDCGVFLTCIYLGRWLCMVYLQGTFFYFIFLLLGTLGAIALLQWLLVRYVFGHPYAGFFEVLREMLPFYAVGLVLGMLLKFARAYLQQEVREANIRAEQKDMQFGLLQSQLSPHFLFNVLNNLYGISLDEHERIPPLLLSLSDLLRYAVYGAKKTHVPLREEIAHIQNYIAFEKIRSSDRLVIASTIEPVIDDRITIAPLVLIVFIENAFKHAKNSLQQKLWITLSLKTTSDRIHFVIKNSFSQQAASEAGTNDSEHDHAGLGIANTRKRLDLLYGNDYSLQHQTRNDEYIVELSMPHYS